MNDNDLRALVRESIAKQLAPGGQVRLPLREPASVTMAGPAPHASHAVYHLARDSGDAEPCIIEPSVPCTHCNYCKSHGH